jgi:hypothetical protein
MSQNNDDGLRGQDKSQGDLRNEGPDRDTPEGLKRPRKGPLDKDAGRRAQAESVQQPQSPGEPAGGE